jgi:outer membrane protein assembly factor BamD (BamD/ComL family)
MLIEAQMRAGQRERALARADRFLAEHPASIHRDAVARMREQLAR